MGRAKEHALVSEGDFTSPEFPAVRTNVGAVISSEIYLPEPYEYGGQALGL